ncbi:MAG: hypothetical protein JRH20_22295 [Deltaproteobacteria bacterium]|nr:hypothetical protein [Deltaproteobacteria bacterium]
MDLPLYALVGTLPVHIFNTKSGGMGGEAWDSSQGAMVRTLRYVKPIFFHVGPGADDVTIIHETAFLRRVVQLEEAETCRRLSFC